MLSWHQLQLKIYNYGDHTSNSLSNSKILSLALAEAALASSVSLPLLKGVMWISAIFLEISSSIFLELSIWTLLLEVAEAAEAAEALEKDTNYY